jgi:hypothetical protein
MPKLDTAHDPVADRYAAELESALLARALSEAGGLPESRARSMLASWVHGTFNAAAYGIPLLGTGGPLEWEREGNGLRLVWTMPGGLSCPLARLYPQADGSWVALVVAGVKSDPGAAMAAAEWAISRLTGD